LCDERASAAPIESAPAAITATVIQADRIRFDMLYSDIFSGWIWRRAASMQTHPRGGRLRNGALCVPRGLGAEVSPLRALTASVPRHGNVGSTQPTGICVQNEIA
jgi:hypothetical protein